MLQTIVVLSEPNYAGNIIINLASLPDFLRKPILKKRMTEFFSMSESEKSEIINNALEAGPTIPFPNFSKLFKTWLEVLCVVSEESRHDMFSNYIKHVINEPQKIISFNKTSGFTTTPGPTITLASLFKNPLGSILTL